MKIKQSKFYHLRANGDEFVFDSKSEAVEKMETLGGNADDLALRKIESDDDAGKFSVISVSWKDVASMVMQ